MDKERDAQIKKRVDYLAKDEETQSATGVVMVPNTVDHQGDWERPETIDAFADQFGAFMEVDEADGGIMHAVWPSDWMTLERNEVLDSSEEIGGETVPEGAWVQTWSYNDDEVWGLVEDGILSGHSIGAVNAEWEYNGEEPEDLPDNVTVPDEVDVAEYWELTDGIIQEVSTVDIPAVPRAQILSTSKARAAAAEKRLSDHVGNRGGFIEEAQERGHSEAEAEQLWSVLNRAINVDGAGEPGAKGKLSRAATTILGALTGSDDGGADTKTSEAPVEESTDKDDPDGDTSDSQTMSDDNEPPEWAQELKAQVEENNEQIEAALEADGEKDADEGTEDGGEKDAFDEAPEWAKELRDATEKNAQRIDDVAKASGTSQQIDGGAQARGNRKYSSAWDDTLGLPTGGDA